MTRHTHIAIFTDGKPGHENQSLALAEALARRIPATLSLTPYVDWKTLAQPDVLISAGHRTHHALLRAKHLYKAPAIVLMKPSLPSFFFDYVIAPKHDYPHGSTSQREILTEGMLCRLPETLPPKKDLTMFLIGGPSKHYHWNHKNILSQVDTLIAETSGSHILTDSRRTPSETRNALAEHYGSSYFPHEETSSDWLPHQLSLSQRVWVSSDSMSMIYESLTSGAEVGLLSLPLAGKETRLTRSINDLIQAQRVNSFPQRHHACILQDPLHEAGRVAELLLSRGLGNA